MADKKQMKDAPKTVDVSKSTYLKYRKRVINSGKNYVDFGTWKDRQMAKIKK